MIKNKIIVVSSVIFSKIIFFAIALLFFTFNIYSQNLSSKDKDIINHLQFFKQAKISENQSDYINACTNYQKITNSVSTSKQLLLFNLARCSWNSNNWDNFSLYLGRITNSFIKQKIAEIVVNSIGDKKYFKIFLNSDVNILLKNLPILVKDSKFIINYLKFLNDSIKIDEILYQTWLISDSKEVLKQLPENLKKKFNAIINNASKKDWEKYFKIRLVNKNYKHIIEQAPNHFNHGYYADAIIKYYLISLFETNHFTKILKYTDTDKLIHKYYPFSVYELQLNSYLKLNHITKANNFINNLKKNNINVKIYNRLNHLMTEYYFYFKQDYQNAVKSINKIDISKLSIKDRENSQWQKLLLAFFLNDKSLFNQVSKWYNPDNIRSEILASHFCYWITIKGQEKFKFNKNIDCFSKYPNQYYGLRVLFDKKMNLISNDSQLKVQQETKNISTNKENIFFLELIKLTAEFGEHDIAKYLLLNDFSKNISVNYFKLIAESLQGDDYYYLSQEVYYKNSNQLSKFLELYQLDILKTIYPLAYKEIVTKAMNKKKFSPHLVYSIMREESHYNPKAISIADAKGLMQIIDGTAKSMSKHLSIKLSSQDIYKPEINIKLGTNYLNQLINKFNYNLIFTIASYNAGPSKISKWINKYLAKDIDIFVEKIPYGETRRYVKRVLRSYFSYQLIYK